MTWFKVDDGSAFNAKVLAAGNEAWGAFCRVGAWCAQQLTDGRFSRAIAVTIAPMRVWEKLIAVGLVDPLEKGEMQMHDYLQRNPSKEQVLRERAATKARVTGIRNGRRNGECTPVQPPGETRLPSRPVPSRPEREDARAPGEPSEEPGVSERRLKSVPPAKLEPSEAAAPDLATPPNRSEDAAPGNLGGAGGVASGSSDDFAAYLRSKPKLADLDVEDLATLAANLHDPGNVPVGMLREAIDDANDKAERGEQRHMRHARVVGFMKRMKTAPRKSDPKPPALVESDDAAVVERIRAMPRRKTANDLAPVTGGRRAYEALAASIGQPMPNAKAEADYRDKAQADQQRLAEAELKAAGGK